MAENKFKKSDEKRKEGKKRSPNIIMKVLDGSFMTNEWTRKQLPFIFFIVFLAVLNIANIISVEKKHRQKKILEKELSVLRAKYSFYSEKAAQNIKPSIISEKLNKYGIKNSSIPEIKIKK